MGMTINEAIKRINNIMFTKFTTVKDEDAFFTAIDTMRKYQKITEIVKAWREVGLDYDSCDAMENIERVIEDGNVD